MSLLLTLGASRADAAPPAADSPVVTAPAANAVIAAAPAAITIAGAGSGSGQAAVFASDHSQVAAGPLTPSPADPAAVELALPPSASLTAGVYSVVWSVGSSTGTFAFDVDPSGAQPQKVVTEKPSVPLGPLKDGALDWPTWIAMMGLVGLCVCALLVLGPAARRAGDGGSARQVLARGTTRLMRVAAGLGVLFVPAFLIDQANAAAAPGGSLDFGAAWSGLFDGTPGGRLLGIEFVCVLVAVALILPLTSRRGALSGARTALLSLGALSGAAALCSTKFPTAVPDDWGREAFDTGIWFGHLLGGAVWIGGLLGLLALALPGGIAAAHRSAFWPGAIRRFSIVAMTCVAAIGLSGLWLYWMHVDGLGQLLSTMYGRVLGVKILIFGTMFLLGAVNQFWLHPRIDALRAAGDDRSLIALLGGQFRAIIAVEALLGITVLLVAPFLHGSARKEAVQDAAADLARSARAGSQTVTLTPSGLQPGLTDYTVRVSGGGSSTVTLSFASPDLGVPAVVVAAQRLGGDDFRVTGFYTPQVGSWRVEVALDGGASAPFTLPVTAKAVVPKAPPKDPRASTWAWGTAETLAVVALMVGGFMASGRIARRRASAARPTATEDDDVLQPA
jgi:putative copper export protein/methionine-rich copper-binding protein CopC